MSNLADTFKITERRCKVCMSPIRDRLDLLLLAEERNSDGAPYTYSQIVDLASAHGVEVSEAGLSRHRSAHLQPAVMAALESQRAMDAISSATGRKLSLHSAVANVIATKVLKLLDDNDLSSIDVDKALRVAMRAAEVSLKIEKAEKVLTVERVQEVEKKLVVAGLSPETLATIRRDLYGLVDDLPEAAS